MTTVERAIVPLLLAGSLLVTSGCAGLGPLDPTPWTSGPYTGLVRDARTKEPLDGAIVVAFWRIVTRGIAHPHESFHAAHETATDSEGKFWLPGPPMAWLPGEWIGQPQFQAFKPGYDVYPGVIKFHSIVGDLENEGYGIIELEPLDTQAERLSVVNAIRPGVPHEEIPLLNAAWQREMEAVETGRGNIR